MLVCVFTYAKETIIDRKERKAKKKKIHVGMKEPWRTRSLVRFLKKSILNWGFVVYFTIVLKLADEKQKKLVSHTVLLKISPFFRCIWICTTPKGVLVFFQRQSCVVLKTTFFFAVAFCVTVWTFLLSCSYGVWLLFPSRIKCGVSTSMMHSFDVFFCCFLFLGCFYVELVLLTLFSLACNLNLLFGYLLFIVFFCSIASSTSSPFRACWEPWNRSAKSSPLWLTRKTPRMQMVKLR